MLGAPFVVRSRVAATPAAWRYVVGTAREEVVGRDGGSFFVQPGLLKTKLGDGARHPYLRALTGDGGAPASILDVTLGLAGDALHAAAGLGVAVDGVEGSAVMRCLLEEGLPRLARDVDKPWRAAARVRVVGDDAASFLRACRDGAYDVVALDPMMSRAKRAAPAFDAYRAFAVPGRATPALLADAARVAAKRVVLKLGKGAPRPAFPWTRVVPGAHVVYCVHER